MVLIRNSFDGGTDGDNLTTGNTGGSSGTAFNDVNDGTQTNIFFDNDFPFQGALGARFVANASANQNAYCEWGTALLASNDAVNDYNFEAHIYVPAGGITNEHPIMRGVTTSGAQCWRCTIDTNRRIRIRDSGNSTLSSGTSLQLTAGNHYRVEVQATCNATGSIECRIYNAADTLVETQGPFTPENLNATGFGRIRFGFGASISPAATLTAYIDAVAASDEGWIGPWPVDAASQFVGWGVPIG